MLKLSLSAMKYIHNSGKSRLLKIKGFSCVFIYRFGCNLLKKKKIVKWIACIQTISFLSSQKRSKEKFSLPLQSLQLKHSPENKGPKEHITLSERTHQKGELWFCKVMWQSFESNNAGSTAYCSPVPPLQKNSQNYELIRCRADEHQHIQHCNIRQNTIVMKELQEPSWILTC